MAVGRRDADPLDVGNGVFAGRGVKIQRCFVVIDTIITIILLLLLFVVVVFNSLIQKKRVSGSRNSCPRAWGSGH